MKNGAIDCENLSPNENDFISAIPTDMLTVDLLAMGESFACATENGGHVRCWGESSTGNLAPPTTLKEVVQIAAGPYHACAINKAHDVICWGLTSNGQTSPPLRAGTTPLMDVEGAFTSCQWNDVGIRCTDTLNSTMPAPDLSQVLSINLASDALTHTACAITQDPAPSTTTHVQCWGGGKEVLNVPSEVVNPVNLAVTENSACAVLTDGSMKCWGVNKLGPVPDTTNVQKVLMARTHGCLIDHFGFTCWGPGVDSGNLVVPEALKEPGEVIDFAITNTHTCVLTSHGTVQCWGDNYQHESEAPPLSHPTSLIAFLNTTCASDDNGITCWGAKPNFSLNETANTPVSHVHFNHSPNNTPP